MRLAIILASGCLLFQLFYHGACLDWEDQSVEPGPKGSRVNISYAENLKRDLFINYNKFAKALKDGKESRVKFFISVRHVDIDELKGKITVYSWASFNWVDDRFQWNPTEYGKVDRLHVKSDEIWHPDVALFNSATDRDDNFGSSQPIIYNTGAILYVPPAVFTAFCSIDLQLWPFDTQECHLKIGSWTEESSQLEIDRDRNPVEGADMDLMVENSEWEIENVALAAGNDSFYSFIRVNFKLKRRAALYKALIFTPASCIVLMVLASFWLPPQMCEKLLLNGIVIIVISAFLMYFAQMLPVLAQNTPLVVLFYSSSLLLVSISTLVSVFVLYLSSAKHRRRVPSFLRNILNGPLSYVLCLSHLSSDTDVQSPVQKELTEQGVDGISGFDDQQSMFASTTRSIQFDWIILATAIDRIFFLVYCIAFIIMAVVYSV